MRGKAGGLGAGVSRGEISSWCGVEPTLANCRIDDMFLEVDDGERGMVFSILCYTTRIEVQNRSSLWRRSVGGSRVQYTNISDTASDVIEQIGSNGNNSPPQ
jgi:hypothetical protein